jgi:hypothetical protein
MDSMDSIWTIFWLGPQPFYQSIPTMDSMEFPMNFNCKSMYYSIWNPWTSPYGIHGTVHMDSIYGILRDLIRIVMNVFKYNLRPLLYI